MPWIPAENPRHLPAAPDALAPAVPAPVIPMAPPGHPDNGRAWSREGAAMTPELQRDTQPYLQAIMKMGGDFKVAHASGLSESIQAKALKGYLADNPLPKDATSKQRRAFELGAKEILDNLEQNLPIFREVRDQTRDLRNEFKTASATAATYTPERQQEFEARYQELREKTGRQQPSLLEQSLPVSSPLRTKLDPLTGGLRDPSTGLYANMVQMGSGEQQKNVLMFGGTGVGGSTKTQLLADAGQFMGGLPKGYEQAAALVNDIRQANPGVRLETAGHSLGGGLAHYAALKNGGIQATCFNAAALGGGAKASIGGNLDQAKANVRHINVNGDLVGDGIGNLRIPLQQAADRAQATTARVSDSVATAGNSIRDRLNGAGQRIGQVADSLGATAADVGQIATHAMRAAGQQVQASAQAGQAAFRGAGERAANAVQSIANTASAAGQQVQGIVGRAAAPMQQAAWNAVEPIANAAASAGQQVQGIVGRATAPMQQAARNAVEPIANAASAAGQQVQGVASRAAAPMQQAARNVVEPIANAASAAGQQVQGVASRAAALVQHSAGAAGHAALSASDQMGKLARSAGTSVRDALRGAAGKTESGLNRIGEGVSSRANQAGNQLKESAPGQKLVSAKEAALTQFENLGISRGKLAIPHQYGGCITMENGGKNNPIGNHLTGAIAKAYDRNERQNNALRNHVTIGQRDQTAAGPRIGR